MNKLRRQLTNSSIKSIPASEIDHSTVIEVKNHLIKLNKENADAFDADDVAKYVNDTKHLRRFIQRKGNVEDSTEFVSNVLRWRKENGLNKLNMNSFPREWFSSELFHLVENNLNGDLVAFIRGQYFLKGPATKEMAYKFVGFMCYYIHDLLVKKGDEFGLTVVFDSTNLSLSQYDFDFISFMIDLLTNRMPDIVKQIVLYEVPWYCMPLLKTILYFIPEHWKKVIVHANSKSLKKYVARDSLPGFFPLSTRSEPIEKVTTLEDKKLLKDFTDEELDLLGMKRENFDHYYRLLKHWAELERKKIK